VLDAYLAVDWAYLEMTSSRDVREPALSKLLVRITGIRRFRPMMRMRKQLAGLTLTELLCVIAIIAILASMYLGAIAKAFARVVKFLKGM
jgi:prepilin-type N-terminal cleavage/methylation domain-containing protein